MEGSLDQLVKETFETAKQFCGHSPDFQFSAEGDESAVDLSGKYTENDSDKEARKAPTEFNALEVADSEPNHFPVFFNSSGLVTSDAAETNQYSYLAPSESIRDAIIEIFGNSHRRSLLSDDILLDRMSSGWKMKVYEEEFHLELSSVPKRKLKTRGRRESGPSPKSPLEVINLGPLGDGNRAKMFLLDSRMSRFFPGLKIESRGNECVAFSLSTGNDCQFKKFLESGVLPVETQKLEQLIVRENNLKGFETYNLFLEGLSEHEDELDMRDFVHLIQNFLFLFELGHLRRFWMKLSQAKMN